MDKKIKGQRFSLIYLPKNDLQGDSPEMRFRIAKLLENEKYQKRRRTSGYVAGQKWESDYRALQNHVEAELGVKFATHGFRDWAEFLKRLPISKLLDSLTIAYQKICEFGTQDNFISEVNRIFREERASYELDEEGGVHPLVDGAFANVKWAAIQGLNYSRYDASRASIMKADTYILKEQPDYISAIRCIFDANENIFKLIYTVPRLDKSSAEKYLLPDIQRIYESHALMQRASAQIIRSFAQWIEAAHHYRHAAGEEQPAQPKEELAIILISEGMSFTRWLVAIDKKLGRTE
jgi:hypothetical protein